MTDDRLVALVTGASSGLGREFCRQLARRCEVIIAVARRAERLESLAEELRGVTEVQVVVADLTSVEGLTRAVEALRQQGPVDILVNNAGFANPGAFSQSPIDGQRDMVSLHIDATISLCRAAIPFMLERDRAAIINVASLGAFLPMKGVAVYGASKAFLVSFSQALQAELMDSGIKIQCLCPGHTRTEFHDTDAAAGFDPARVPDPLWMEAKAVVAASLAALAGDQLLVVPGAANLALARQGITELGQALDGA